MRTLTRTLTVALAGLVPGDEPMGRYLFLGPSGTGKTHLARVLAQLLHGDGARPIVFDCHQAGENECFAALGRQLAPHVRQSAEREDPLARLPDRSVLVVEHLESASREFCHALMGAGEAGGIPLPDGNAVSLRGTLLLLTSGLCAREIYGNDTKEIGFAPGSADLEDGEKARIYQACASAAEKHWGARLLGHLDDLIVFHRLRGAHLPRIVGILLDDLNRGFDGRLTISLRPEAVDFLVERGRKWPEHGAWFLVKIFRRFVVFPLADLLASRPGGARGRIEVAYDERRGSLRFELGNVGEPGLAEVAVPVTWA